MNKISIIIPMYNAIDTISRCVESIINQTYKNIEIIVIDDGSIDGSFEKVNLFYKKNPNIKIIHQNNSGVSSARNTGISHSTGELIMFVDSDDSLKRETCEILINEFNSSIDLMIFGLNIYKDGKLLRSPHLEDKTWSLVNNESNYWSLRKINLGPCNKIYKKELINKLFDTSLSLGEDTKFVIDYMVNIHNIKTISSCLYNVNLDNINSLNRKYRDDRLDQLIKVRDYELNFLKSKFGQIDSQVYNEYFYDLHVILYEIANKKVGIKFIIRNIEKKNYRYIFKFTSFSNKYYSVFAYLATNKCYHALYALLVFRKSILKILENKKR